MLAASQATILSVHRTSDLVMKIATIEFHNGIEKISHIIPHFGFNKIRRSSNKSQNLVFLSYSSFLGPIGIGPYPVQ